MMMNRLILFKTSRRKAIIGFVLSLSLLVIFSGCDEDNSQVVTRLDDLVMSDEFDSNGAPNSDLWSFEIGTGGDGWGNNELQYYTDRPENVQVQNGQLIITARQESFEGSNYTSARLLTKGKFEQKYGRFEARMWLPWGQGIWPAFWMLGADIDDNPWPDAGEIDIMEYVGQHPTVVFGTVHGPGYSGAEGVSKSYDLLNDRFDTGFHIFGIEWSADYVRYYVDDVLYNQITPADVPGEWVFDKPFFMLINLAVGGSLPGPPNSETVFPQTMLVDYVRVYK
ncbi:MAG: glycoside hydrolase family 16 protein [Cyclobacteriaceae bacterium]